MMDIIIIKFIISIPSQLFGRIAFVKYYEIPGKPKRMIVINAIVMKLICIIRTGIPVSMNLIYNEGSKLYTLGLVATALYVLGYIKKCVSCPSVTFILEKSRERL